MKAAICTKYGPPEVLEVREVPKPTPKENELLVRVVAASVNSGEVRVRALRVDGFMRVVMRLVLGFSGPRNQILGTAFSGVVEGVGEKVQSFKIGDRVFGATGFRFGTHAEYLTIKEKGAVIQMPQNASFDEAAAIVFGGQTAIYFLRKAGIEKLAQLRVLIVGGTGAVGSAAIQIAKSYDAEITAVCSSEGVELVRDLGAGRAIAYDREDFTKEADRFDIVFDAVGKAPYAQCAHLLKPGGVYKTVEGFDVASDSKEQLAFLKKLFEGGKYSAVIDKTFSLDQVREAHRYVDAGRKKGNVVLRIAPPLE